MNAQRKLVVYAHDIANILGCSKNTARRLLRDVRKSLGKRRGDYISIEEFCEQTRLPEHSVRESLKEDGIGY